MFQGPFTHPSGVTAPAIPLPQAPQPVTSTHRGCSNSSCSPWEKQAREQYYLPVVAPKIQLSFTSLQEIRACLVTTMNHFLPASVTATSHCVRQDLCMLPPQSLSLHHGLIITHLGECASFPRQYRAWTGIMGTSRTRERGGKEPGGSPKPGMVIGERQGPQGGKDSFIQGRVPSGNLGCPSPPC